MTRRPQPKPERKQPTPDDLVAGLLTFIRTKFYAENFGAFAKDKRRLLDWVVLYPARWFDERGVTVPATRYREILTGILLQSVQLGNTGAITYPPAWLAKVVQSHFAHHGDELYEEAKSMRNLVETALLVAGQARRSDPDPVRELAQAARLLRSKKVTEKRRSNGQLTLL